MQSTFFRAGPQPIPSPKGLEHLLVMNQAATYINAAVVALHKKYGDVFAFGFGPIRFHWFVGHDALQFVLQDNPASFSMKRAYGFLETIGGSTALISSDEPEHLQRRQLVQPAFHGSRLQRWSEQFQLATRDFYEKRSGQTFDFYAHTRAHMLEQIVTLLLGKKTLDNHRHFLQDIEMMMHFANLPFLAQQFKIALPGTPWYHFLRARERVDSVLYHEIQTRNNSFQDDSLLALLLASKDELGQRLTDKEIRDQCVSLVSAGFDTTSATLTWAVYLLLTHSEALAKVRDEMLQGTAYRVQGTGSSVLPPALDGSESRGVSQTMRESGVLRSKLHPPFLDAVLSETLRLYPAAPAGLRLATRTLFYKGFLIPEGSLVAYSIYATHRQEDVYPNATQFNPERWLEEKAKHPNTFDYLPFGYGARYCIGARLATMLIKLHLTHLLKHYEVEAAWQHPIEEAGNTVHPREGLPVQLKPTH
jgi:cytochrome P450